MEKAHAEERRRYGESKRKMAQTRIYSSPTSFVEMPLSDPILPCLAQLLFSLTGGVPIDVSLPYRDAGTPDLVPVGVRQ